jgi:hypothetical protein
MPWLRSAIAIAAAAWLAVAVALAIPITVCAETSHPHVTCSHAGVVREQAGATMMIVLALAALAVLLAEAVRERATSGRQG